MIIPSIDIQNGKVVQLRRGKELVLTDPRPAADLAREFGRYGEVAVVDLDAAMGTGDNREIVAACCLVAECRVGGGIRTHDDVRRWIKSGAKKVVIGTMATPEFLSGLPRDWIVAAVDARGDKVVVEGWKSDTGDTVLDRARAVAPFSSELLLTQVEREGMLGGCDLEQALELKAAVDVDVCVAGGITTASDVKTVIEAGLNAQIGLALYKGMIDLTEAWIGCVRFDEGGLVPTVVQETDTRNVLMLAYSSAESLEKALALGQGWYFSRSRNRLWRKGESSGNTQRLVSARWDCDRDTILFEVEQTGPACHTGRRTCFGSGDPSVLADLSRLLRQRRLDPEAGGYTRKLLDSPDLVAAKLREEIDEVIEAETREEVAWEAADVLYHLLVRAEGAGVGLSAVLAELRSRFKPSE